MINVLGMPGENNIEREKILFELNLLREDAARILKRIDSLENLLPVLSSEKKSDKLANNLQTELQKIFLPSEVLQVQAAIERDFERLSGELFVTQLIPLLLKCVDRPLTLDQIRVLIDYTNTLSGAKGKKDRHSLSNTLSQMKKNKRIGKMAHSESKIIYYYSIAWQDENKKIKQQYLDKIF